MHVPGAVQPCPSCYAYCVPRPPQNQHGIPPAPPIPRHAHPPVVQQSPRGSPGNSPHQSPHRTQPRPLAPHPQGCNHPPFPGPRFGSLPHSQPAPKIPPHYNSLPHRQPPPPNLPSHPSRARSDVPPPPRHAAFANAPKGLMEGNRPPRLPAPEEPLPAPPPHGALQQQHPVKNRRGVVVLRREGASRPLITVTSTAASCCRSSVCVILLLTLSSNVLLLILTLPGVKTWLIHSRAVVAAFPPTALLLLRDLPLLQRLHHSNSSNNRMDSSTSTTSPRPLIPRCPPTPKCHRPCPPRPPGSSSSLLWSTSTTTPTPSTPTPPSPQPFTQLRYGCLPHTHLVPPPPLAIQHQQQQYQQQRLQQQHQQQLCSCHHLHHHHHHHIVDFNNEYCSLVKVDRGYCGKGPPGRGVGVGITKSYSIESSAPPIPPHHLHHYASHLHQNASSHARRAQLQQAVSQPSGVGLGGRRQPPRGSAADDSGNRNSRWRGSGSQGTGQGYELSQDLADMRLEMLERRYGGAVARRAAITIQRAYRHYAMYKKFRSITATAKAQEKRLSRRFTVDVPEWSEPGQHCHDAEHIIRSEFDQLQRNLSAAVYGEGRRPARSLSMRDSPRTSATGSITTTAATTRPQQDDNYDLHDTIASMSDSSLYCHVSAQSPLTPTTTVTPSHTHARNGSGDYQQQQTDLGLYASAKELKYFSSEDSGLGSQDSASLGRGNVAQRGVRPGAKKVPPEVPRRSSSIKSSESGGSIDRSADNGSMSSVQSSGSDSSLSQSNSDRATPLSTHDQVDNSDYHPTSPIWKRKNQMSTSEVIYDDKRLSNISENSEDSLQSHSSEGMTYSQTIPSQIPHSARYANAHFNHTPHLPKVPEVVRKRQYRVGLNLFNKKPEKGITYLIGRGFLENSSQAVAKFLLTRKGLSKQMIGEYLGNLQNNFNMAVLECFAQEIDLSGMQVDVALRKFQTHFRMPGEAQKIERLVQVFAQRYCQCNRDIVAKLRDPETIFVMAFAIIMLNTDLHTASMKQEKRMKLEDFIKNLRGIDDGYDIEREMLEGMYQRIKSQEFRIGHDHVTQVLKVQQTMVGKKPNLALPHRRLVCYCRLYEIPDVNKRERVGVHQREVFLFNDLLVVTKIFSKKKSSVTYTFRQSFPLAGLSVTTKEVPYYPYLMEIRQRVDSKLLITFNARNEHDRSKFCEDLKESICEMDEMENLRIEGELERQKASLRASRPNSTTDNRDSGVADMELLTTCSTEKNGTLKSDSTLKRSALSNSLLDIHEAEIGGQSVRRGSVGSLDSGMSVSFQSTSASNETSPAGGPLPSLYFKSSPVDLQQHPNLHRRTLTSNTSFLGQLFRPRRTSRSDLSSAGVEV
ncbi:IQ motif and SEC7 domain-containing protein 1-like isoform X3 [Macrobrachium rosenbergii]|uniref:IQ motif and SEC7 domain-containing protein 1-like isoform X3 n=1 Tax=Macrobrachium rosenbergii TaxID=79674 RepID=UPI0034D6444B